MKYTVRLTLNIKLLVQTCFTISPLLNMSHLTSVVMLSDGLNHRTEYEQCMNSMSCSSFTLKVIQSYWMNHFFLGTNQLYNLNLSQPDASKSSYSFFIFGWVKTQMYLYLQRISMFVSWINPENPFLRPKNRRHELIQQSQGAFGVGDSGN